jgi:short-subunit dehydrogenase
MTHAAKKLNEQVIVITGASSGIGRQTAIDAAQRGASVVLAARNQEALDEVQRQIARVGTITGGKTHVVVTDVTQYPQVEQLAAQAIERFGRIDTWVNNAGASVYGTVEQTSLDEMRQVVEIDLMGTIYGVKAVLPIMIRQRGGTIINVGSVLSNWAVPLQSAYTAAKHGVRGFSESLRMELAHEHPYIHVSLIMPASINTPFFRHARSAMDVRPKPVPPVYEPELPAQAILDAAENPQPYKIVGGLGKVMTLIDNFAPGLVNLFFSQGGRGFKQQQTEVPNDGLASHRADVLCGAMCCTRP